MNVLRKCAVPDSEDERKKQSNILYNLGSLLHLHFISLSPHCFLFPLYSVCRWLFVLSLC